MKCLEERRAECDNDKRKHPRSPATRTLGNGQRSYDEKAREQISQPNNYNSYVLFQQPSIKEILLATIGARIVH